MGTRLGVQMASVHVGGPRLRLSPRRGCSRAWQAILGVAPVLDDGSDGSYRGDDVWDMGQWEKEKERARGTRDEGGRRGKKDRGWEKEKGKRSWQMMRYKVQYGECQSLASLSNSKHVVMQSSQGMRLPIK